MNPPSNFSRHTAVKMPIKNILESEYISNEKEELPNYLLVKLPNHTENDVEQKVFRINLMATVLKKEIRGSITNFLLDDGTGNILLRFFENDKNIDDFSIGDSLLIIGKLRKYNHEKYISPEIYKKISPKWLKVRSLELELKLKLKDGQTSNVQPQKKKSQKNVENVNNKKTELNGELIKLNEQKQNTENNNSNSVTENVSTISKEKEKKENKQKNEEQDEDVLPIQKILTLIKELDNGQGVIIENVITNSPLEKENTEQLIDKMLENGDIFQNSPGKVKVL